MTGVVNILISALLILFLTFDIKADEISANELKNYINWYLIHYEKRKQKAYTYIPIIEKYSDKYNIDPLLIAIIISCESSWKLKVIGKIGEQGLMQVHGIAMKGFNIYNPDGQIHSGVKFLSQSFDRCKSITGAISYYMTGKTCKPIKPAKYRYGLYKEAVERFRK